MKKFYTLAGLVKLLENKKGKVIFVHGIFDILHKGHIMLFTEAKKHGDCLVVGLDHDDNAKILKGKDRPFNKFEARLFVLEHITDIDYIFKIPSIRRVNDISSFYTDIYRKLSPYAIATSIKAGQNGKYKMKQAEIVGIEFIDVKQLYKLRTTDLLALLKNSSHKDC